MLKCSKCGEPLRGPIGKHCPHCNARIDGGRSSYTPTHPSDAECGSECTVCKGIHGKECRCKECCRSLISSDQIAEGSA